MKLIANLCVAKRPPAVKTVFCLLFLHCAVCCSACAQFVTKVEKGRFLCVHIKSNIKAQQDFVSFFAFEITVCKSGKISKYMTKAY